MTEYQELLAAIITFWGSVLLALWAYKKVSYNTIHESTGWREGLMKIASSSKINLDNIYRLRASVYPYTDGAHKLDRLSIQYCDYVIEEYSQALIDITPEDQELCRILCRGLLHINWIYNTKHFKKRKADKIYENIEKELKTYTKPIPIFQF